MQLDSLVAELRSNRGETVLDTSKFIDVKKVVV